MTNKLWLTKDKEGYLVEYTIEHPNKEAAIGYFYNPGLRLSFPQLIETLIHPEITIPEEDGKIYSNDVTAHFGCRCGKNREVCLHIPEYERQVIEKVVLTMSGQAKKARELSDKVDELQQQLTNN